METSDGGKQSPALGLLHELGNSYGYLLDPDCYNERANTDDDVFDNKEEKWVIENIEYPAAEKLCESTRTDYDGEAYLTDGPTSTESPKDNTANNAQPTTNNDKTNE